MFLLDLRPIPVPEIINTLQAMPTEVLERIARYLPVASEAALTLTCRLVLSKLGRQSWQDVNSSTQPDHRYRFRSGVWTATWAREDFILLLERDLKDLVFCILCNRLHGPIKLPPAPRSTNHRFCSNPDKIVKLLPFPPPKLAGEKKGRKCTINERKRRDGVKRHYFRLLDDITYTELKHSMKLHLRFGADCADLLRRLSNSSPTFLFLDCVSPPSLLQVSTLARVIAGHLVIRSEYYIHVPWHKLRISDSAIRVIMRTLRTCFHDIEHSYRDMIDSQWPCQVHNPMHCHHCRVRNVAPTAGAPQMIQKPVLRGCQYCETEFEIVARGMKDDLAVNLRVWQDLDDCGALQETIWDYPRPQLHPACVRMVTSRARSVKVAFEEDLSATGAVTDRRKWPQLQCPKKTSGLIGFRKYPEDLIWASFE